MCVISLFYICMYALVFVNSIMYLHIFVYVCLYNIPYLYDKLYGVNKICRSLFLYIYIYVCTGNAISPRLSISTFNSFIWSSHFISPFISPIDSGHFTRTYYVYVYIYTCIFIRVCSRWEMCMGVEVPPPTQPPTPAAKSSQASV